MKIIKRGKVKKANNKIAAHFHKFEKFDYDKNY